MICLVSSVLLFGAQPPKPLTAEQMQQETVRMQYEMTKAQHAQMQQHQVAQQHQAPSPQEIVEKAARAWHTAPYHPGMGAETQRQYEVLDPGNRQKCGGNFLV